MVLDKSHSLSDTIHLMKVALESPSVLTDIDLEEEIVDVWNKKSRMIAV